METIFPFDGGKIILLILSYIIANHSEEEMSFNLFLPLRLKMSLYVRKNTDIFCGGGVK